jgi:DNA repair protein RecO (recombination protein O)
MFVHYRTKGLFLERKDRGEADQLFTIYTKDFGKLEILGKAIRKIKSKLRSGANNFCISEVEFIQGKAYKTLTDTLLIDKFEGLKKDLKKIKIAYQIAETFNNLVREQEKDKGIWNLLKEIFKDLSNSQFTISRIQLLYYYFLWKLFSFLGYSPQLYNCAICQKKVSPGDLLFSSKEGGIICPDCFKKIKKGKNISPEIIKILRFILEKNWSQTKKLKVEDSYLKDLRIISTDYLSFLSKLSPP